MVFAVALLVRGVHLWQMSASPFFGVLVGDSVVYDAWARRLAAGDWIGDGVFYQAPLYAYFVGIVYSCLSDSVLVLRVVQALLGSMAAGLVAGATRRWFGAAAGWVGGLLLALWPSAIFFDSLVQKTVLDTLLLCVLLALLSMLGDAAARRRSALWVGAGVTLGLLVLCRENAMVLLLPLLVWAVWSDPEARLRDRFAWALALALGLSMTLFPVVLRNGVVGGEFHITTSQLGSNLFIGNNPAAIGTYMPLRPGRGDARFERTDAVELASLAMGRPGDQPLSPREVSRYWAHRTWDYIRRQPGHWLSLMMRKAMILLNRVEVVDTDDQYTWSEWSVAVRWGQPLLHFGTLLPLAGAGAALQWHRQRAVRWLVLLCVAYALSVVMFYVVARYRFPLVPLLMPLAAAGVVGIIGHVRRHEWRPLVPLAVLAITCAAVAYWPIVPMAAMRASGLLTAGQAIEERDPAAALAMYDRAAALWPNAADLHLSRGRVLMTLGRHHDAADAFSLALDQSRELAQARYALAVALKAWGDPAGIDRYRVIVNRYPDDPLVHLHFAHLLSRHHLYDAAASELTRALALRTDWPEALNARGIAHARVGRLDEAINDFEHALRLAPDLSDARDNLTKSRAMRSATPP